MDSCRDFRLTVRHLKKRLLFRHYARPMYHMQLSLPFEISRVSEYFHFRNMFANRIEVYYVLIYNTIQARCSLVQEKNESVFLCPLEQDNQKNRKNTIEEINLDSIVQSSSIQQNSPAIGEKVLEDKGMPP